MHFVPRLKFEEMKSTNIIRNDQKGRNTVTTLQYYSGFFSLGNYNNLNIHQKIIVRSAYCGVEHPSVMIKDLLKFESTL